MARVHLRERRHWWGLAVPDRSRRCRFAVLSGGSGRFARRTLPPEPGLGVALLLWRGLPDDQMAWPPVRTICAAGADASRKRPRPCGRLRRRPSPRTGGVARSASRNMLRSNGREAGVHCRPPPAQAIRLMCRRLPASMSGFRAKPPGTEVVPGCARSPRSATGAAAPLIHAELRGQGLRWAGKRWSCSLKKPFHRAKDAALRERLAADPIPASRRPCRGGSSGPHLAGGHQHRQWPGPAAQPWRRPAEVGWLCPAVAQDMARVESAGRFRFAAQFALSHAC